MVLCVALRVLTIPSLHLLSVPLVIYTSPGAQRLMPAPLVAQQALMIQLVSAAAARQWLLLSSYPPALTKHLGRCDFPFSYDTPGNCVLNSDSRDAVVPARSPESRERADKGLSHIL